MRASTQIAQPNNVDRVVFRGKPSLKHYGHNRIFNRRYLAKLCPMSALLIESIRIPKANNSENLIVNRRGLTKHCPRNPLSVANRKVDVQQNILKLNIEQQYILQN